MNVFLVENQGNSPGKIMAVFANEEDADKFAGQLEEITEEIHEAVPRTLHYGQPAKLGYNV